MQNFQFIGILIALCFVTIECSVSIDCGSIKGKDVSVDIEGCPDSMDPCLLHKGKNVNVTITFTALEAATALTSVVHGEIHGFSVHFPVDNPNACVDSNITCPLVANQRYYYHTAIPIKSYYPSLTLTVKWELQDSAAANVVCVEIPAQITSSAQQKRRKELTKKKLKFEHFLHVRPFVMQ